MIRVAVVSPKGVDFRKISSKSMLKDLQDAVGGNIELYPHPEGMDAPYVAYANEEGALLGLPDNDLATETLAKLGFMDFQEEWGRPVMGNVVILGKDEKSLSKKEHLLIAAVVTAAKK